MASKIKEQFYVDPEVFKEAIRVYYQTGECTVYLGECLTKIANGLSYSPSFGGYSYRDEFVGDAIVKMYSALKRHKFNVDSETSPFSYFTTIAFHAFINRIKREKKQYEALTAYRERCYEEMMTTGQCGDLIYVKPQNVLENNSDYYYEDV